MFNSTVSTSDIASTWSDDVGHSMSSVSKGYGNSNSSESNGSDFAATNQIINGIVIPTIYFALFVVGIIINSVVLYASAIFKVATRSTIDIYVGNLAFADLCLVATLPVWAITHINQKVWAFGDATCKIASMVTNINMYSSIFLITAMAIDRYTVVVKGIKVRTKSLRSPVKAWSVCTVVWFSGIILSIPAAVFRKEVNVNNLTYCRWVYPQNQTDLWWAIHVVERNVIAFFIPLVVICRCYMVLISYVRSKEHSNLSADRSEARAKQVHRITKMVIIMILAFTICWLPNQTSNFIQSLIHYRVIPPPRSTVMRHTYYVLHVFFTTLSFCNSIVNPIIYSTSPSHRRRVLGLMTRIICCSKILNWVLRRHSPSSRQSHNNNLNGSPESFHRSRKTIITRIGHAAPGSPHSIRRMRKASDELKEEILLQSPTSPGIPIVESETLLLTSSPTGHLHGHCCAHDASGV